MLAYNEHEVLPRPEESRVTRVEKNERINKQLKVRRRRDGEGDIGGMGRGTLSQGT